MYSNFTEETCTGTGNTLVLTGNTAGRLSFSKSFSNGESVSYVLEDSAGIIKLSGIGTYVSASNTITRNDSWNWNGTVIDENPSTNITLSGGIHAVRCDVVSKSLDEFTNKLDLSGGILTGTLRVNTDLELGSSGEATIRYNDTDNSIDFIIA